MSGSALDFTDPIGMPALAALFLFGLLGSGHCVGMCGGIITALNRRRASIPIVPVERAAATCKPGGLRDQLAWNVGRLTSYALAGALAGTVGSTVWLVEHVLPVQRIAFVLTSLVMLALGLQMLGVTAVGATLERAGRWFWPIVQPAARSSLRLKGLPGALAVGMAWGWVPCGMVYGALGLAIMSGSAASGARCRRSLDWGGPGRSVPTASTRCGCGARQAR